jgi:hypothetical protein
VPEVCACAAPRQTRAAAAIRLLLWILMVMLLGS